MLDYDAVLALATVVREGSFERAARSLCVTPSAVSQRVRHLEERVGCALVIRAQPCLPTDTGLRLCQHLNQVQLLEHDLHQQLPGLAPSPEERVALPIAVNADSLATWFGPVMAQVATREPVLLHITVDDQAHTDEWLRSGAVLAAVTARARPVAGCNSRFLGIMRYHAAASPAFVQRYLAGGVDADRLAQAPSLEFNTKDGLQAEWVRQHIGQAVELPRHTLPSPEAFVAAAEAGMGWGMHPYLMIAGQLDSGRLVELLPGTPVDVPLYWQQARSTSALLDGLSREVFRAAAQALSPAPSEAPPGSLSRGRA